MSDEEVRPQSKNISRRDFLKMLVPAALGTYAAVKAPDFIPAVSEPEIGEDANWNAGELGIQAYPAEGKIKFYARPYGNHSRFEVTLSHIGSPVLSEVSPHETLHVATGSLSNAATEESYSAESTGYGNRVIGSMYPVEAGAKLASIKAIQSEAKEIPHEANAKCEVDRERQQLRWEIDGGYGGEGYFKPINKTDKINFVSSADFAEGNVVGMKPSEWFREYSGIEDVVVLGGERFAGVSLEHTTPSAWVVNSVDGDFAMAASYANHATLTFADKTISDRKLTPGENNFLNTPTPFVIGSDKPTDVDAEYISSLPEMTFSAWKEKYPDKPFHQGQTFIFNKEKGTFRVVEKDNRLEAIRTLSPDEVWLTPGEVMLLNGEDHYSDEIRFKKSFDMTINGFIAVPDEAGNYRPVQAVTTDQRRRFSLHHAEQIANSIREQLDLPKNAILINWDKHGAGGIFVGGN